MLAPLRIFIGYDEREAIAYHVCVNSIIRHASAPVAITPLALHTLKGCYEEQHTDGSNAFIYSRFLVPYLSGFTGVAVYIDGDMLVNGDIHELALWSKSGYDVAVVKHDYVPKLKTKYLGAKQEAYEKKNWSSVMVFNCYTSPCQKLRPEFVADKTGAYLHRFQWTTEDRILEIPKPWNWLAMEYDKDENPKIIHYTNGAPCFADYKNCDYAKDWWDEWRKMTCVEGRSARYE